MKKNEFYVWVSGRLDLYGKSSKQVKVALKSVVYNDVGGISLLYTSDGPKYFGEVTIPEQLKSRLKEIEKK